MGFLDESIRSVEDESKRLKKFGLFPELAASALWHRRLGDAYRGLSYIHLGKNQGAKALKAASRAWPTE